MEKNYVQKKVNVGLSSPLTSTFSTHYYHKGTTTPSMSSVSEGVESATTPSSPQLKFNTSGSSMPGEHYYLDPLTIFRGTSGSSTFDFAKTKELIFEEKYFLVYRPCQSMKTSYLKSVQNYFNTQLVDQFHCVYATMEQIQGLLLLLLLPLTTISSNFFSFFFLLNT